MNPDFINTYEFQRHYMRVLWTEYRVRKANSPLGKEAFAGLLIWARKAQKRARALRPHKQGDLFA